MLAGETLDIMVSTDPPAKFRIEIFRTGYYGGRGARLMTTLGPFQGTAQPIPPVGDKRLRECRWTPSTTLKIPADWPSGVYLGRLTTLPDAADQPYWQSYVIFIVRDTRRADVLFQCSDNTWQAYNRWPDNDSLYTDPRGAHARDVAVSFDRPYGRQSQYTGIVNDPLSVGSGEFLSFEQPLAYFLEEHGYDVTYCSNSDCLDASQITRCKAFISVGHDEYWDVRQYHATKAAIEAGVNVLWLSGNSVFAVSAVLQLRRRPPEPHHHAHRPLRRLDRRGVRGGREDRDQGLAARRPRREPDHRRAHHHPVQRRRRLDLHQAGPLDLRGHRHEEGRRIPGLVGWEHHGAPAKLPGLEVVAEGTVWAGGVTPAHWTATIFPGPKNNFVFNAATIFWAQGLSMPPGHTLPWSHWSRPHGPDARVQQITHNLLRRAIDGKE